MLRGCVLCAKDHVMNRKPFSARQNHSALKLSGYFEIGILLCLIAYFISRFTPSALIRHIITLLGFLFVSYCVFEKVITSRINKINIVLAIALAAVLVCGILASSDINLDLVYRAVAFYVLLLLFLIPETNLTLSVSPRLINLSMLAITIISIALSVSSVAYLSESGRSFSALTLGMTNPNLTGMILAGCIDLLVITLMRSKNKVLTVLSILSLSYLLWKTDARSSIVAIAATLVYASLFSRKRIPQFVQLLAFLTPIIAVPLYLWAEKFFLGTVFLGKPLFSGREVVFATALSRLDSPAHYLFGALNEQRFDNAHNSFLTIYTSIGFVGALLSEYLIGSSVLRLGIKQDSMTSRMALLSLLFIFVQSSAEAGFLSGVFPTVAFLYFLILFAGNSSTTGECLEQESLYGKRLFAEKTYRLK